MIEQNQYDLILMDHMMPDMDGVEATKIIRSMKINDPIVALTANAAAGTKDMFLEAGMNDVLTKPVNKVAFFNILAEYIPQEKQIGMSNTYVTHNFIESDTGVYEPDKFWGEIENIVGLYADVGLDRVSGQREIYKASLKMMTVEIEKCRDKLSNFLTEGDMHNYEVLVHSMKSSLANIGAMDLSERAAVLERAAESKEASWDYCLDNTGPFLADLSTLGEGLKKAFAANGNGEKTEFAEDVRQQLTEVFAELKKAFATADFTAIDKGLEALDALALTGHSAEEVKNIKEMVGFMDYEGAEHIMNELVG
jgi:HPt (histidine-containing phosphotransfer) domain-containing protein